MAGLIVVDHGSKLESANRMLDQVVDLMAATPGFNFQPIVAAHMDLAAPSIAEALYQMQLLEVREVYVFPYFLSPGRHTQQDIPRLVREAAEKLPGMQAHVADPFGLSPKLIEAALLRIRACRDKVNGEGPAQPAERPTTKVGRRSNRTTRRMKPQM